MSVFESFVHWFEKIIQPEIDKIKLLRIKPGLSERVGNSWVTEYDQVVEGDEVGIFCNPIITFNIDSIEIIVGTPENLEIDLDLMMKISDLNRDYKSPHRIMIFRDPNSGDVTHLFEHEYLDFVLKRLSQSQIVKDKYEKRISCSDASEKARDEAVVILHLLRGKE